MMFGYLLDSRKLVWMGTMGHAMATNELTRHAHCPTLAHMAGWFGLPQLEPESGAPARQWYG